MNRERPDDLPQEEYEDEEDALPASEPVVDLAEAAPGALKAGIEVIQQFARHLPNKPGVYRMFDRAGEVLYVGKAKSLKNRVSAYARGMAHTNAVARMIAETANMEFVTTGSETEALLLESNLIKQLRPRYNVLLRDDKSFPYILLSGDHEAPALFKHRGSRHRKGDYFGPFASVWAVKRTIDALQKAFLIRTCSDSFYENRTRPCLLYQIKRCSGPCTREIEIPDYQALVGQARDFLSGRSSAVKKLLSARMQEAAEELEFEKAARYRDRLAALSAVQAGQDINTQGVEEADVFAIDEQAGHFCVEIFFFRNHQNWGNRALFPRADRSLTPAEVLASVVAQFYDDKPPPRLVLLSHPVEEIELIGQALSARAGRKVEVAHPKRGERADLMAHAVKNAREALSRKLAENAGQQSLLAALGAAFGLETPPRRVEVYDNSHIMGTNAVGGMIVAGPDGFMKSHYRTFNISTDTIAGDDFGMMREVLTRRFARLAKEEGWSASLDTESLLKPPALIPRRPAGPSRRMIQMVRQPPRPSFETPLTRLLRMRARTVFSQPLKMRAHPGRRARRPGPARTWTASPPAPIWSSSTAARASSRRPSRSCGSSARPGFRWSPSPRGRTGTRCARPSTWPGRSPSSCSRATRRSISSSACATRRTASPSARTGPSASATR